MLYEAVLRGQAASLALSLLISETATVHERNVLQSTVRHPPPLNSFLAPSISLFHSLILIYLSIHSSKYCDIM